MNPQSPEGQPPYQPPSPQLPPPAPLNPAQPWPQPSNVPLSPPSGPAPTSGPEQQYTQPPSTAAQQYDFILAPEKKAKLVLGLPGGNGLLSRLLLAGGGVVVLIIAAVVIVSLLNGKSGSTVGLTAVAQDQTELIRVAKLSTSQTTSQTTQNIAMNVILSLSSDNQQLVMYLANNNVKLGNKQLALKRDNRTDTQLQTASAASTFDSAFISIIQTQLATYQRDLKTVYASKPGPKGETLLSKEYTNAGLLLQQSKQPAS